MSEQDGRQVSALQRPTTSDSEAWNAYWKALGQPWRTEPEIDVERQMHLAKRRGIKPDIEQGNYPFKDIKLTRADVEWLLATHENGRGPVDWEDTTQRRRGGLDLRGADLSDENLRGLPLSRLQGGLTGDDWTKASIQQRHMAAVHLERAVLTFAHLEGSVLTHAHLQGTVLQSTHLESVDAFQVYLDGQVPANLRYTYFDTSTKLEQAKIANEKHVGPRLLDIHWGEINLTGVDWSSVRTLYDEHRARNPRTFDGILKDRQEYLRHYREAARAYHQLAQNLQQQGITEDAARFAYRAQKLQRVVLLKEHKFGNYFFSLFLDLLAGYGYKPGRTIGWYLIVISGFAIMYSIFGHLPLLPDSLVFSLMSFHGRGFFPSLSGETSLHNPLVIMAAAEAVVGLLIEISFIATFTKRFFGI